MTNEERPLHWRIADATCFINSGAQPCPHDYEDAMGVLTEMSKRFCFIIDRDGGNADEGEILFLKILQTAVADLRAKDRDKILGAHRDADDIIKQALEFSDDYIIDGVLAI